MALAGIGDSVEGIHAVAAAAAAGRVRELSVEQARAGDPEVVSIIAAVERSGGVVTYVPDVTDLASTDAPQGVVAATEALTTVPVRALATEQALVVVLDHLQDPRNVGAVARSAAAAGASGIVTASRRAAPLSATAFKAAAGALETLAVAMVSSIPKALDELRRRGLWIVGLDAGGDKPIFELELLADSVAVVIGSEGGGLGRLVRDKCDVVASIPMRPPAESLNAAMAATLACYETARIRGWVP